MEEKLRLSERDTSTTAGVMGIEIILVLIHGTGEPTILVVTEEKQRYGGLTSHHKDYHNKQKRNLLRQPAIAAMHGPHSDFDICHCTTIHCDAGGVSPVDQ